MKKASEFPPVHSIDAQRQYRATFFDRVTLTHTHAAVASTYHATPTMNPAITASGPVFRP